MVVLGDEILPEEWAMRQETFSDEGTVESTYSNSGRISPMEIADTVSSNKDPSEQCFTEPFSNLPAIQQSDCMDNSLTSEGDTNEHSMENQVQEHSVDDRRLLEAFDQKAFSGSTAGESLINASVSRACDSNVSPWYRQGVKTVAVIVAWLLIGTTLEMLRVGGTAFFMPWT